MTTHEAPDPTDHRHDQDHDQDDRDARTFWEEFYAEGERWSPGRVNPVLAMTVEPLTPGRALDVGCGEGGDAIWLARRGWEVTAVDVSAVALSRAAGRAAEAGVGDRISWEQHDLERTRPSGRFDLVSAQFLQSPVEFARERVLREAAQLVAPGGLLVVVAHAAFPPWSDHHDADQDFPTPESDLAALALAEDEWQVVRAEVVERDGTGPDGTPAKLFDSVVICRRAEGSTLIG